MNDVPARSDAVVIGGGLAGLTAAVELARGGRSVALLEKSAAAGGRAATENHDGFFFNLGPHALYRHGEAARGMTEMGIPYSGGMPSTAGGYAVREGSLFRFPGSMSSLLSTGLLPGGAKLELAAFLASIRRLDTRSASSRTVAEWLRTDIRRPDARRFLESLVRLATYANDPRAMSAGDALDQIRRAVTGNVLYLDGGWQTLVGGLAQAARDAGVRFLTGTKAERVEGDGRVTAVRLATGDVIETTNVVAAMPPGDAARLAAHSAALKKWAAESIPIRAACLDVALSRLPRPRARFALGVDRPVYLSVHSAVARLAPPGGATVQLARYLETGERPNARMVEVELEELLDLVQPGWREVTVRRRFLPSMMVSAALPLAHRGGTAGRPGPEVQGISGLFVAGDWVGPQGLLADAAVASARQAARLILHGYHSRAA